MNATNLTLIALLFLLLNSGSLTTTQLLLLLALLSTTDCFSNLCGNNRPTATTTVM